MPVKVGTLIRTIAIDALTHIMVRGIHSEIAIQKLFDFQKNLRPLDKALVSEIVLGSLRWLSKMDWIMSHVMNRPLSSLDPRVVNALRVGAYQLYYMQKVSDRTAVSETVEAVKQVGVPNAASFVNAILRRISKRSEYFPKPDKNTHYLEYCAMQFAHPLWMIERWFSQMSKEKFEYLLVANNIPSRFTIKRITKNPLPNNESQFDHYFMKRYSLECSYKPLHGAFGIESAFNFADCAAYKNGCYIVQNESQQLCTNLVQFNETDTLLDVHSSPGSSSIFLWDKGLKPEQLTVCDDSSKRIKTLEAHFERVGLLGSTILKGNVLELCRHKTFSRILLHAPSSTLGGIRKNPELKWHSTQKSIEQCAQKQKTLLAGLASLLLPNGELVYIADSFEPEETTNQIDQFLIEFPQFEKINITSRVHDYYRKYITKQSELVVYGGNPDNLEGIFAVVLKKNA